MSLLLALAMQVGTEPNISPGDEIVVIGQKQKFWRGYLKYKKDIPSCKTTRTTGDKAIDQIGCDAMIACFPEHRSALATLAEQHKKQSNFDVAAKPIYAEMGECLVSKRDRGISELADKRLRIAQ